jgi:hypothetical protein
MDADNSDYGFNGFTAEAYNTPVCIDLLSITCLLSEQVFISPSQRSNGIVVYDFKINQDVTNFVLTLTSNNGFLITGNANSIGAFQIDPRGLAGPDFDPAYQPCPPGSNPSSICNPVQFGPNANGLATGTQTSNTATFTVPGNGNGFVFYVAVDEKCALDPEADGCPGSIEELFTSLDVPDPLGPSNVTASIKLQTSEVPEPNSLPIIGIGLAAVIAIGRRRLSKLL